MCWLGCSHRDHATGAERAELRSRRAAALRRASRYASCVGGALSRSTGTVLRVRGAEVIGAAIGCVVGLVSSSLGTGVAGFVWVSLAVDLGLGIRDRVLRSSSVAFGRVISARLRDAGIECRRSGGGDGLLSEPVLVSWHSFPRHEVFDQDGNLLAARAAGRFSVGRLLRAPGDTYADARGQPVLELAAVDDDHGKPAFAVFAPDGSEIGIVSMGGKDKGSIRSAGVMIGRVEARSRSLSVLSAGRRFSVKDAKSIEVGRVTHFRRLAFWNIIEVGSEMTVQLRGLLLAVDAAVSHWTTSRGGG